MSSVRHAIKLGLFLFAIWLLLSGHFSPLLLALGILSTLLVVVLATRADLIDRETQLILLKPSVLLYWLWLGREIIKSNIDVARRILSPGMPISPNIFTVRATQQSDLGRVTYANSITLVPGTVAMDVDADIITVHALTAAAAADLQRGEMNQRVCQVESIFPCSSQSPS
jgi:multicomponent Na+:H+ antiporter subunit E